MAVTIPTNITGLALVQCRMVAGIAHLRGYDLDDPRVRNAILVTHARRGRRQRPGQEAQAAGPADGAGHRAGARRRARPVVSAEVATELITQVAGKRLATTVGRRVPVVGGLVGMGADGYATWQIGRYADRELLPRARR